MGKKLGDLIKEYRTTHKMSMDVFAKMSGISKAYISMLENDRNPKTGKPIEPSLEIYIAVAKATGKTLEDIMIEAGNEAMVRLGKKASLDTDKIDHLISSLPELHPIQSIRPVPILGEIACGTPIFCEENFDGYVGIDTARMKGEFALYCHGNSMIEAGISEGDLVLLRKTPDVENGAIAAVYIDGEATLKKIYRDKDNIVLQPCNRDYSPIVIPMKEAEEKDVFIIGECIGVYHEI